MHEKEGTNSENEEKKEKRIAVYVGPTLALVVSVKHHTKLKHGVATIGKL